MYVCYIDESGTPNIPDNTSHFVLAGISIPVWHWRKADAEISSVMKRFGLEGQEFHTAWVLRNYLEQSRIPRFEHLNWPDRRIAVERLRNTHLLQLQKTPGANKTYRQLRKNYAHTEAYIHLTKSERTKLAIEIADTVASWGYARLFAECIDKIYFGRRKVEVEEQAFEQVVSRFENYLGSSEIEGE